MLVTCVVNGWPLDAYLDQDHPLQRHITTVVERLGGEAVAHVGIDGCGAPAHTLTLTGLAHAFAAVASAPAGSPMAAVRGAMTTHPEMVGGTGRDVTALMAAVPGLVAKDGAEGVLAAALPDGRAVALKLADGSWRAFAAVAAGRARPPGRRHLAAPPGCAGRRCSAAAGRWARPTPCPSDRQAPRAPRRRRSGAAVQVVADLLEDAELGVGDVVLGRAALHGVPALQQQEHDGAGWRRS